MFRDERLRRLCRYSRGIHIRSGANKKAPQIREKSWGQVLPTKTWTCSKQWIFTAYGGVRALIRHCELRHHYGDSLRARSIPTFSARSLDALLACRHRSRVGWLDRSPDRPILSGEPCRNKSTPPPVPEFPPLASHAT